MARIRTVKPEFWTHEGLSSLPESTHLLAAALINYSDDFGYFNANVGLVKAACSPLREPLVSIPESLRSLQTIGYVRFGSAPDGRRYGHIVHFGDHQRVSHPTPSKIAALSIAWEGFGNPPEPLGNPPDTFRPEGKGKEQGTGKGIYERAREPEMAFDRAPPSDHSDAELSSAFGILKVTYPIRSGRVNWIAAEHAWRNCLEHGATLHDLQIGVDRYAAYVANGGVSSPAFVLAPEKFFGAVDKPWSQLWALPAGKARMKSATEIAEEAERANA